ncbi:sigma-54 factor interaction domain-containing protein [Peribacillus butanolivorans]|uniref:sigma 54-interacting transcriptional regulator n=1 Tax=Peribacillus butanolivorans TaxID=421767 RepID=UPI00207C4391|nr:sigma 54-interacting transcriptional regulator [Peribacillus butanolivorans]MCO0598074.1 sigma-54 factor interaction domain-containing protein [Peribacillus butanolivorans]
MEKVKKVAAFPKSVLITGDSGTGKEVLANYIHQYSPQKDAPFIKVHCAAIPVELFESVLFGYAEGAFTGA